MAQTYNWSLPFLDPSPSPLTSPPYALIILNQPFSAPLLRRVWSASAWHSCADGGANRLHDTLKGERRASEADPCSLFLPDLIKGDLDSLRDDVREYYASKGVPVVHVPDEYSTDLMKCIAALSEKEKIEGIEYDIVILGGLSGRLDQTVHTLSLLHKLRDVRKRIFVITDDNVAWVLKEGEHHISINHAVLGQTCGLLPVGVASSVLTTTGLRWNLTDFESSFDGMVSTSNHLVPEEKTVYIKTSKPIWWSAELKASGLQDP
ncbi:thiamine pyrophosphokinase [Amylocystis lapponica]|nr:thiamine pyrophosphokinase [Amylocystis lapponica]